MINRQRMINMLIGKRTTRCFNTSLQAQHVEPQKSYISLWDQSEKILKERESKLAAEADYLAELKKFNTERGAFTPFEVLASDIPATKKIKSKINSIIERELVL
jgi:hypothetical protein